jgi:outer membrane lipoprotein-sorting protein
MKPSYLRRHAFSLLAGLSGKSAVRIMLCAFLTVGFAEAQKAEMILEKAAAAYEKSNGIEAHFTAHIHAGTQGGAAPESLEGTICMKGDKFRLITPDVHTWYDGETQWTYVVRTDEVNLSNPSGDELQYTNPMTLLRTWKKGFRLSYIGESTSDNGKMADDLRLVSSSNREIETIELQIDRTASLPVRITVTMKNGVRNTIRISRMRTNVNPPDTVFTFNPADYPGVVEVDLR